jgi:Ran GTPase-activating protein 1
VQGISGLASLRTVDLCQNQIRRGGACALAKACCSNPHLELLALDENEISEAGVEALKAIMKTGRKLDALGSLEENMPDEDDGSEEEGEEEGDEEVDGLADQLAGEKL